MEMVVDGLSAHYEVRGHGPSVFLLHGWGSSSALFNGVAEVLSSKYRVVSLDFPGCGGTPEPDKSWGMDDYVHFTTQFISAFSDTDIVVLGHSHGGRVAIRLATDAGLPFRISKLILVGCAGILPQRTLGYHLRVRSYKLGKAILQAKPLAALFPEALGDFQARMGSTDYAAASAVMRGSLVKVVNTDLEPLLPRITAETLLVWGRNDQETPLSDGQTMEKAIPGSGLVVLEGAGHYCFLDQAYTFDAVLSSFLGIG